MRAALLGVVFVLGGGSALAQPKGVYSSEEGKYSVKFPGEPKVSTKKTRSDLGELKVVIATYATADGNAYMVSYTDFPAAATKPENRGTLYDGVRDGVKGRDGKLVSEKEIEFGPDKLPGREVVVDKGKGKQRVKFRVVLRDDRLYQVLVTGTTEFVGGKDATRFLESLELTK
jgi:hypothetical protein